MPKSSVLSVLVLILTASIAAAAPVATFELQGAGNEVSRLSAEILGYTNGRFSLRRTDSGQVLDIAVERVRAIDFGLEPRESTTTHLPDLETVVRMATTQDFAALHAAFAAAVKAESRDFVTQAEQRLAQEEAQADSKSERRKNLLTARILATRALGEEKVAQQLRARLEEEFPGTEMPSLDRRESPPRERPRTRDGARSATSLPRGDTAPAASPPRE